MGTPAINAFDARVFARTLAMGCVMVVVVVAVMLATDAATTTTGEKVARLAAMAPVLGGLGSALSNAQARARGEVLALTSVGAKPIQVYRGSLVASAFIGLAGACALGLDATELGGLFPRLEAVGWEETSGGGWLARGWGVTVTPAGEVVLHPGGSVATPTSPRGPVVATVAGCSALIALWIERGGSWLERVVGGAVVVLLGITLFHLTAAGRVSPWTLLLIPGSMGAHLLVGAVRNLRLDRREKKRDWAQRDHPPPRTIQPGD